MSQRVDAVVQRRVVDEFTETTADTLHTGFVFTLPDDSTPSFCSSSVSFRWALQFEFHVALGGATPNRYGCIPSQLLRWGVPLAVTSPPRAYRGCAGGDDVGAVVVGRHSEERSVAAAGRTDAGLGGAAVAGAATAPSLERWAQQ